MSPSARLVFVLLFTLNCILWSQSRYGQIRETDRPLGFVSRHLFRYNLDHVTRNYGVYNQAEKVCRPLAFAPDSQCTHVLENCPTSDTVLSIPYLSGYFCTETTFRPAAFVGLLIWLIFLFSTLGISASDFFTPNLATLAQLLGLDENVAGVTFLAFGNGSPDVFSTFSAMHADSGSLAIGELLGAASFIVSCVIGSMCIIKPFKVHRKPFLRDVGFFTASVSLLLGILWDGVILPWEAGILVVLYVLYVLVVVIGSWWDRRQEHKRRVEALIRAEYEDDILHPPPILLDEGEPYRDNPTPSGPPGGLAVPTPTRARAVSSPMHPRLDIQTELPPRARSRTPSPIPSPRLTQMPSFSLVGALEFRQVVTSLQLQASSSSLDIFESPVTPYAGGHYHRHPISRHASREIDPWDAALGVPLNERSPQNLQLINGISNEPDEAQQLEDDSPRNVIPSISRTPASPVSSDGDLESHHYAPPSRRQRIMHNIGRVYHILCPSLHHFKTKSFLGKIASVFAAPAVLALTLTLPVIVTPYESPRTGQEKMQGSEARLIDFEEEGIERALIAEEEVHEDMHEMKFNKWLMAVQCAIAPLFCTAILFAGTEHIAWLMVAAAIAGMTMAILVAVFADKGIHPTARMARCSMGFLVAIVWIMAIADEVVNVLQTFGFIFGLSDAIIGLTIFAVGNSLADLVANMSVAVFAPIMGFSACFGGPMLNILLGVGLSGSYIIQQTSKPYTLHFTKTLIVSTIGLLALLLATVVVVPLNGYFLTRSWGIFLITSYAIIMAINIFVEIHG